jgi:hypothetical protein
MASEIGIHRHIENNRRPASWRGRVAQVQLEALRKVERLGEEQHALGTGANLSRGAECYLYWQHQGLTRRRLHRWLPPEEGGRYRSPRIMYVTEEFRRRCW